MSKVNWQDYIVVDPNLHHGDACIKGTRIPVATILGSLADGMTIAEIQTAYPQLTITNVQAALAYAADIVKRDILAPLSS